jgi:acyl-CoA oxidase
MVHVRANIVSYAAVALARALTVAIRYSAVRRQGSRDATTGLERQVRCACAVPAVRCGAVCL